ncbi:MAG: hypothetical protein Q8R53_04070 [Nanoarchaeota archaeon]|nr:hypothetical protein [Nanoarchaeota archaeon]
MKSTVGITISVLFLLSFLAVTAEEQPPSLTNFHRFYGQISNLPIGTFTLKAVVGTNMYQTAVAAEGWYGVRPSFKVYGTDGQHIAFSAVNSLGTATALGNATFQSAAVTKRNFTFPSAAPPANVSVTGNVSANVSGAGTNGSATRDEGTAEGRRTSRRECRQDWQCTAWSACLNNRQTRTCVDRNNCEARKVAGNVTTIVAVSKPLEVQACLPQAAGAPAPADTIGTFCAAGEKRCVGKQLQQCSGDGQRWATLETCAVGCDSDILECSMPPKKEAEVAVGLPSWIYLAVGIFILAAGGTLLLLFLLKRKREYGPARQYVAENRRRGVPDMQIKQRLVGQGWDPEKVDTLLK